MFGTKTHPTENNWTENNCAALDCKKKGRLLKSQKDFCDTDWSSSVQGSFEKHNQTSLIPIQTSFSHKSHKNYRGISVGNPMLLYYLQEFLTITQMLG